MGNNPSRFKNGGDHPVEQVNWYDVEKFISRLNEKTGINCRLPTEAEWEYAARSGGKNEYWAGTSNGTLIAEYAWYFDNSGNKTQPVGQKKPNGLGLHDMSGNVCEWIQDWYDKDYYRNSPTDNPQCKQLGYKRHKVIRGGMCQSGPMPLRTISRASIHPSESVGVGFRLALPAQPEQTVIAEKEQPPASGKKPYGTPPPSLQEPLNERNSWFSGRVASGPPASSKPFQKEGLKDEAPPDAQSVKPKQGGLGVGAKIGLTVMVVLIGGMIFGLIRNIVGHGHAIWAGIAACILIYIWSRPRKKANK
jgi:hypothetical protein